jgi:two-component system, OmpR family, response regulator
LRAWQICNNHARPPAAAARKARIRFQEAIMRVLVVEDEIAVAQAVARLLDRSGFTADRVASLDEAQAATRIHAYDLILLDRRLPDGDGLALLEGFRRDRNGVRVVMLTACDAKAEIVQALDAGADDYLTKPFDADELLARVRASMRRLGGVVAPSIQVGALVYDPNRRDVRIHGAPVVLHGRELKLLEILLRNCERMAPREAIIEEIYGFDDDIQVSALNSLIMRLRRRLDDLQAGVVIHMARGVGYMLTKAAR